MTKDLIWHGAVPDEETHLPLGIRRALLERTDALVCMSSSEHLAKLLNIAFRGFYEHGETLRSQVYAMMQPTKRSAPVKRRNRARTKNLEEKMSCAVHVEKVEITFEK